MKEFREFSKEDQKLICEALQINNEMMLFPMFGKKAPSQDEFVSKIENMSYEAKEYLAETLKNSLPEEYR